MTMLFFVHVNIDDQLASTCINLHGGSILNDLISKRTISSKTYIQRHILYTQQELSVGSTMILTEVGKSDSEPVTCQT